MATMTDLMATHLDTLSLFLFVPADRPERVAKAAAAGADAIIIDLEDAVAPENKAAARAGLVAAVAHAGSCPVFVRINAVGTAWHPADVAASAGLPIAGIVLPKAEAGPSLAALRARLGAKSLIALIESAVGLADSETIARACDRLAFGSIDFALDLGCAHTRDALLLARSRLVLAARLAGKPAPIDGVTQAIHDADAIEADARYAADLGFSGKLLIHPVQVTPARRGHSPAETEIAWAERVVASSSTGAAMALDGVMIDAPVLARARRILIARDQLTAIASVPAKD